MKPYHLFREKEACFVYHLDSGRFIRVSPAAYGLLELRETMSTADAAAAFHSCHPDETGVLNDVAALEGEGFFELAEEPVLDDAAFEEELDARFSGPCNTLVLSVASGCNLACRYCKRCFYWLEFGTVNLIITRHNNSYVVTKLFK